MTSRYRLLVRTDIVRRDQAQAAVTSVVAAINKLDAIAEFSRIYRLADGEYFLHTDYLTGNPAVTSEVAWWIAMAEWADDVETLLVTRDAQLLVR